MIFAPPTITNTVGFADSLRLDQGCDLSRWSATRTALRSLTLFLTRIRRCVSTGLFAIRCVAFIGFYKNFCHRRKVQPYGGQQTLQLFK